MARNHLLAPQAGQYPQQLVGGHHTLQPFYSSELAGGKYLNQILSTFMSSILLPRLEDYNGETGQI